MREIHPEKHCPKCGETKSSDAFSRANRRTGLAAYCKECSRTTARAKRLEIKETVYAKLGNICSRCGFFDPRALQIDHVFGDGTIDRKTHNNELAFFKKVLADETGSYQILCANCNWIKRHEDGEQPKGQGLTEEGRKIISESRKAWVPTEEQRQKMVDSHLGQIKSPEQIVLLKASITESWKNPEHRRARIDGLTGKTRSPEVREKIRQGALAREARKKESGFYENRAAVRDVIRHSVESGSEQNIPGGDVFGGNVS